MRPSRIARFEVGYVHRFMLCAVAAVLLCQTHVEFFAPKSDPDVDASCQTARGANKVSLKLVLP